MAEVTIGGRTYAVSLPNFKTLKQAWRHIAAVQSSDDPMTSIEAILGIVAVGAAEPVTRETLEEALKPTELPGLRPFLNALMVETGLAAEPSDPLEAGANPSTATSTPSSAPSSPGSEAPTGTG